VVADISAIIWIPVKDKCNDIQFVEIAHAASNKTSWQFWYIKD
jgi:hypothetical protein